MSKPNASHVNISRTFNFQITNFCCKMHTNSWVANSHEHSLNQAHYLCTEYLNSRHKVLDLFLIQERAYPVHTLSTSRLYILDIYLWLYCSYLNWKVTESLSLPHRSTGVPFCTNTNSVLDIYYWTECKCDHKPYDKLETNPLQTNFYLLSNSETFTTEY